MNFQNDGKLKQHTKLLLKIVVHKTTKIVCKVLSTVCDTERSLWVCKKRFLTKTTKQSLKVQINSPVYQYTFFFVEMKSFLTHNETLKTVIFIFFENIVLFNKIQLSTKGENVESASQKKIVNGAFTKSVRFSPNCGYMLQKIHHWVYNNFSLIHSEHTLQKVCSDFSLIHSERSEHTLQKVYCNFSLIQSERSEHTLQKVYCNFSLIQSERSEHTLQKVYCNFSLIHSERSEHTLQKKRFDSTKEGLILRNEFLSAGLQQI